MGVEIERKWLVREIPANLDQYHSSELVQGYLCTDPVVRPRRDGDAYYLTYKGYGSLERTEYNLPLSRESFDKLISKCDGIIIRKKRYFIPLEGGYTAELDIFHGEHQGKAYVEVEFDSVTAAEVFKAPEWFGMEVTGKKGYSNADLAMQVTEQSK